MDCIAPQQRQCTLVSRIKTVDGSNEAELSRSATNEIGPIGNLQSFSVNADGSLTLVDTVATGGNGPTFTNPLSTGEVSAMNVSTLLIDYEWHADHLHSSGLQILRS